MGARPSSFKKGGGYLNEVDAKIVGYTFEVGDEAKIKKGARKGETFTPLSLVPEFEVDGEDETKTQRLLIGDANGYGDIEEDGQVLLTPDGQALGAKCEAAVFIASLCEGGFEEDRFDDDNEKIDFRPMIGTRVRLVQEKDEARMARVAKDWKSSNGKFNEFGQQKGKDGKYYDLKVLKVATVHALPDEDEKPAKGSKSSSKPTSKPSSSKKAKDEDDDTERIAELSGETLKAILATQPKNTIAKSKLSMAVLKHKALKNSDDREAVREFLFDEDNADKIDGVSYDKKKQTFTLDSDDDE